MENGTQRLVYYRLLQYRDLDLLAAFYNKGILVVFIPAFAWVQRKYIIYYFVQIV